MSEVTQTQPERPFAATPREELERQIMCPSVPKTEREWCAADEITRLRAEVERLRAALEPLACTCDCANGEACSRAEVNCAFWNARAALKENGDD